jgi:hypothetical protein
MHQEWSPMMQAHPTSPTAVYVSLLAYQGTRYQPDCWVASDGEPNSSLRYDHGALALTIQGRPAALRELAAALVQAAELTEQTYPNRHPARVEG